MKNLEEAVKMAGSVKNLCKYFDRHKAFSPYEVIGIAKDAGFDKPTFKKQIKAEQKTFDERPKISEFKDVLFDHPDIGKSYLQSIDDRISVASGWTIYIEVLLEAKNPDQLEVGLDNPRILQKIKDAGDFNGLIKSIQDKYKALIKAHYKHEGPERNATVDKISQELETFINKAQENAAEKAEKAAGVAFGKKAGVKAETRKRHVKCVFAVVKVGFGVMATAAGFAGGIAGGLVALHGVLKDLDSTVRLFRSSYNGFEKNMISAEKCYKKLAAAADTANKDVVQAASRVAETFFGEAVNIVKQGEQFLVMAEGDLNKIDSAANDIVSSLNKYLLHSTKVSQNISALEAELQNLKNSGAATPKQLKSIEDNVTKTKETLTTIQQQIDHIISHCVQQSTFVNGCTTRIIKVKTIKDSLDPSKGIKIFMKCWEVLELTAGVLGGGFADGGGFSGGQLVNGLNPLNPKQYAEIGNFMGHLSSLDSAISIADDYKDRLASNLTGA